MVILRTSNKMIKNKITSRIFYITIFIILYLTYKDGAPFILNWDTFGYSAYLPMLFINKSIVLHDLSFFENINNIYHNTPSLYQFTTLENGSIITRHTVGWSIVMSPFYIIAHLIAKFFGFSVDGYSLPYQYMMNFGSSFYSIIGLHFLRKILLNFFNDLISAITFIIIVFGTNYFLMQFVSLGSTHNLEFTFLTLLIWLTIKFHEEPSVKKSFLIGICIGLIGLIRPPDLIFCLIPLGWNLNIYGGLNGKVNFFLKNYKKQILIICFSAIGILFIQLTYWKIASGHFFINSYNNAGENFDWLTPYTIDFLFSFRKGWLLYTPVMLFSIIGLFYWRKNDYLQGNFILVTFFLFLYVVSCWTTWWYAASYSQRPMVDIYPLLAIGLGYFISQIQNKRNKIIFTVITLFLVFLNLFQSYQVKQGILHTSLVSKEFYISTFGQLSYPTLSQQKLLLIDRDQAIQDGFKNSNEYIKCYVKKVTFPKDFQLNDSIIYTPPIDVKPHTISSKDHFWVRMTWKYEGNFNQLEGKIMTIAAIHNLNGYNWTGRCVSDSTTRIDTIQKTMSFDYISPYFRNKNDFLRICIWNQSGFPVIIKSLLIEGFEKKD